MDIPSELLESGQLRTLEFFVLGLQDVSDPDVDRKELLYNASVLAHYAQVSTGTQTEWPTPTSLSRVFDDFVLNTTMLTDASMMETAGTQCLLLAGFFEDQMRPRHNISWYSNLGSMFFGRASARSRSDRARFFGAMARNFEPWRQSHARLSRELREQRYLLKLPHREPPTIII